MTKFQIVVGFECDEQLPLSVGPKLLEIQRTLRGRIVQTNAPVQAPPALPRMVLQSNDFALNVALDRIELHLVPPHHVQNRFESAMSFAAARADTVFGPLASVISADTWSGSVADTEFHFPAGDLPSAAESAEPLFDRLVTIPRRGRDMASFQLQFGLEEDGCFVTYSVSAFEIRRLDFPVNAAHGRRIVVDAAQVPVEETGVGITLDVNDRASAARAGVSASLRRVFAKQEQRFATLIQDVNLEGLIA